MSTVRGLSAFSLVALAASVALASCSTSDDACIPPPGSCDAPAIEMNPVDAVQGCLAAPVALTEVCATSVNRCTPSAGLGRVCAFAPDGRVFVAVLSDNLTLSAKGWRFAQDVQSFPTPFPPEQNATRAEYEQCIRAACTKTCPGAERVGYLGCLDGGGGVADAAGE